MGTNAELLSRIATGEGNIPEPVSVNGKMLKYLATGEGEIPEKPMSVNGKLLKQICENGGISGGGAEQYQWLKMSQGDLVIPGIGGGITNLEVQRESDVAISIASDSIVFAWNGGSSIGAVIKGLLNFDEIKQIKMTYTATDSYSNRYSNPREDWHVRLYVCATEPNMTTSNFMDKMLATDSSGELGTHTLTIDTSQISGNRWFALAAPGWSFTVTELEMEVLKK